MILTLRLALLAAALALATAARASDTPARPSPPPPMCQACFWQYFEPSLRTRIVEQYKKYECPDVFCKAEVSYTLGTMLDEPARIAASVPLYREAAARERDSALRVLLLELLAFATSRAGGDPAPL